MRTASCSQSAAMRAEVPRAARLPLVLPIAFRPAGMETWLEGRSINVSESGMLFAPARVELGQALEIVFATPVSIQSLAAGRMICVGRVIWIHPQGHAAASFDECRFLLEDGA